jgi:hypothetical protein
MVERLLKRTRSAKNVVPLPKARPVRKSSTEVLALAMLPALPGIVDETSIRQQGRA